VAGARRLSAGAAAEFTLHVEVMVEDESAANIPTILDDLTQLASPDGVLASTTSATVSMLGDGPWVPHGTFSDSSLKRLTVFPGLLSPAFDPTVLRYSANVTELTFWIEYKANSDSARVELLGGQEENTIAAAAPASQSITVRVHAGDLSTTSYEVEVFFQPIGCEGGCGLGTCDTLTGTCLCLEGWRGSSCVSYCPGTPPCSNHGECSDEAGRCECDYTYGGDDCTTRVCPQCLNNGTCREDPEAPDAELGCDCSEAHTGALCELLRCPSDCSGAGACDGDSGVCSCYLGYSGADCSVRKERLYPIQFCLEVSLVWGIQGFLQDGGDILPENDPLFALDATTQQWLWDTCAAARAPDRALLVRDEVQCFTEALRVFSKALHDGQSSSYVWADLRSISAVWPTHLSLPVAGEPCLPAQLVQAQFLDFDIPTLRAMGIIVAVGGIDYNEAFPITQEDVPETIKDFFEVDKLNVLYNADVGTTGSGYSGHLVYVRQRLRINVPVDADFDELESESQKWASFVETRNRAAPPGAQMIVVAPWITRVDLQTRLLSSTINALSASVGGCFFIMVMFTRNWLISAYTALTAILSMVSLLFIIVVLLRWDLGAVQVIGLTTFIGLAVDYTVHTIHAYQMSDKPYRRSRVVDALRHTGAPIVGGAITTGGAAVFLLPCLITLFNQLGIMLILNTAITIFLTFFFLMPLLMIHGPTGECGQVPRLSVLYERVLWLRRRALDIPWSATLSALVVRRRSPETPPPAAASDADHVAPPEQD
jgi:hypothetical protein